jgi:hypothetical protein
MGESASGSGSTCSNERREQIKCSDVSESRGCICHRAKEKEDGMKGLHVRLGVTTPCVCRIGRKHVIQRTADLVHALHVSDARVELGVDEQDALNHLQ